MFIYCVSADGKEAVTMHYRKAAQHVKAFGEITGGDKCQ